MLPNFDTCRFKRPNGRDGTGCFRAGLNQPPTLRKKILNAGAGGGEGRLYTDSNKETCRISFTSYNGQIWSTILFLTFTPFTSQVSV